MCPPERSQPTGSRRSRAPRKLRLPRRRTGTIVDVPRTVAAGTLISLATLLSFDGVASAAEVPWPAPLQPSTVVRARALGRPIVVQPDAPHVQQVLPWAGAAPSRACGRARAPRRSSACAGAGLPGQPIATIAKAAPVYSKPGGRRIATLARRTEFGTPRWLPVRPEPRRRPRGGAPGRP